MVSNSRPILLWPLCLQRMLEEAVPRQILFSRVGYFKDAQILSGPWPCFITLFSRRRKGGKGALERKPCAGCKGASLTAMRAWGGTTCALKLAWKWRAEASPARKLGSSIRRLGEHCCDGDPP